MNKRERRLQVIERRWVARFGEPPTLRTDPDLMEDILDKAGPAPEDRGARWSERSCSEESVV